MAPSEIALFLSPGDWLLVHRLRWQKTVREKQRRGAFYGLANHLRVEQGKRRKLRRRCSDLYGLELAEGDMAAAKKAGASRAAKRRKSLADKASQRRLDFKLKQQSATEDKSSGIRIRLSI
jgi:hypothetical protein